MQTEEIIRVISAAVERDVRSSKTLSLEASNSPKLVSRLTSAGKLPEVPNLTGLCDTLGLEFYIGPPREGGVQQYSPELDLEQSHKEGARKSEVEALRADVAKLAARIDPDASTVRRIREPDLVVPTLIFLAMQPDGTAKTKDIIAHLNDRFRPGGEDAEVLDGRKDTRFSQIVRNMISHCKDAGSFIRNGYAEYLSDLQGLRITDKGRKLLNELVNEG